jgi:hypothetical protein
MRGKIHNMLYAANFILGMAGIMEALSHTRNLNA